MAEIELTENMLIIHLKGLARFMAFINKVQLTIPLTHVIGAEIDPTAVEKLGQEEEAPESPWSISVGPSSVELGWEKTWSKNFWSWEMQRTVGPVTLEGGKKAFWDGGNPKKSIMIKLTDEDYGMFVLAVTDPSSTLARIERAIQAS